MKQCRAWYGVFVGWCDGAAIKQHKCFKVAISSRRNRKGEKEVKRKVRKVVDGMPTLLWEKDGDSVCPDEMLSTDCV